MMKLLAPALGFACLLWLAVWSWWLTKEFTHEQKDFSSQVVSFSIIDEDFKFADPEVFYFSPSAAIPVFPGKSQAFLKSLAQHLSNHSQKLLTLSGIYSPVEQNKTPHANLGLARAEAIKALLVAAGAPDESILANGLVTNNLVLVEDKIYNGVQFVFSEKEPALRAAIEPDAGQEEAVHNNEEKSGATVLTFKTSKYKLTDTEGGNVLPILDGLRNYLRSNSSKKIIITGYSEKSEESKSSFNLAEGRARAVRRYLVDTGVRRSRIIVKFEAGIAAGEGHSKVEMTIQ